MSFKITLSKITSKQNRALLRELVSTDFKLRYQGSVIGYAWSLLRPLMLFAILYVVFVQFLRLGRDISHFPIYLLLGIVLWSFFSEMTNQSLTSIVARGDLIRKIRIPRWIIVLSSSVAALINLGLNLVVVAVFMVIDGVNVPAAAPWFLLILLEIYVFALGMSFYLAAAFVKFRDLSHIWEVVLQGMFYVTPILYPLSLVTNETAQKIILLNPMAQAIQDARNVLVSSDTLTITEVFHSPLAWMIPAIICVGMFVFGLLYFKRESKYFAENL